MSFARQMLPIYDFTEDYIVVGIFSIWFIFSSYILITELIELRPAQLLCRSRTWKHLFFLLCHISLFTALDLYMQLRKRRKESCWSQDVTLNIQKFNHIILGWFNPKIKLIKIADTLKQRRSLHSWLGSLWLPITSLWLRLARSIIIYNKQRELCSCNFYRCYCRVTQKLSFLVTPKFKFFRTVIIIKFPKFWHIMSS